MGWDPDAEDGDVDDCDDQRGAPFHPPHCFLAVRNHCNPIDDDLHQELNFKHPEEENEKQDGDPGQMSASGLLERHAQRTLAPKFRPETASP